MTAMYSLLALVLVASAVPVLNAAEVTLSTTQTFTGAGLGAADDLTILPSSAGQAITVQDVASTGTLTVYAWQSTLTFTNVTFGKFIVPGPHSVNTTDWADSHVLIQHCTLKEFDDNAMDGNSKSLRIGTYGVRTGVFTPVVGNGTSTFTVVHSRLEGEIHVVEMHGFAKLNLSYNEEVAMGHTRRGMYAIDNLLDVEEVMIEGNTVEHDALSLLFFVGYINNNVKHGSYVNSSVTVQHNNISRFAYVFEIPTNGLGLFNLSSMTLRNNTVTVDGTGNDGRGRDRTYALVYMGELHDTNITIVDNTLTLTKFTLTVMSIRFYSVRNAKTTNARVVSARNTWVVDAYRCWLYYTPYYHVGGIFIDMAEENVTATATETYLTGNVNGDVVHLAARNSVINARGTNGAAAKAGIYGGSRPDKNCTLVFEDNTVTMPQSEPTEAIIGELFGMGAGSAYTFNRNVITAKLAFLTKLSVVWDTRFTAIENQVFTVTKSAEVFDLKFENSGSGAGVPAPYAFVQCNRVDGVPDRFYRAFYPIHPSCGSAPCDFTMNNSACHYDPAPIEAAAGTDVVVSGTTFGQFQSIIVKDNQKVSITGGAAGTEVVLIPHSPGNRSCLQGATIEVDDATIHHGLFIDGKMCNGTITVKNAVFTNSDQVFGSVGIRDSWDGPERMVFEHSALNGSYSTSTSVGFAGAFAKLGLTNVADNVEFALRHSTVTNTSFRLLEGPVTVLNTTMLPSLQAPCIRASLDGAKVDVTDSRCTVEETQVFGSAEPLITVTRSVLTGSSVIFATEAPGARFFDTTFRVPDRPQPVTAPDAVFGVRDASVVGCTFDIGANVSFDDPPFSASNLTLINTTFRMAVFTGDVTHLFAVYRDVPPHFDFDNVSITIDDLRPASTSVPAFSIFSVSDRGTAPVMSMKDVSFNVSLSTTAFPPGQIRLRAGGVSTYTPLSDIHLVVLGGDKLRGSYEFTRVNFGNFSTVAQDVTLMGSTNITMTDVTFGAPEQIRNFMPTGEALNVTSLVGVASELVLNRSSRPGPPVDYTDLLRLSFNGCMRAFGAPMTEAGIRAQFQNLTSVPGALSIAVSCGATAASSSSSSSSSAATSARSAASSGRSGGGNTGGSNTPAPSTGSAQSNNNGGSGNNGGSNGRSSGNAQASSKKSSAETSGAATPRPTSRSSDSEGEQNPGGILQGGKDDEGLSGGATAGIIVGSVVFFILLLLCCIALIIFFCCYAGRKNQEDADAAAAAKAKGVANDPYGDFDSDEEIDMSLVDPADIEAPPGETIPENETAEEKAVRELRWWNLMRDRRRRGNGVFIDKAGTRGSGVYSDEKKTTTVAVDADASKGNTNGKGAAKEHTAVNMTAAASAPAPKKAAAKKKPAPKQQAPTAPPGEVIPENETEEEKVARELRWWKLMRDTRKRGGGVFIDKTPPAGKQ